ncbi:hypothetical protein Gotur_025247 [Gossypium turneri]
MQVQSIKTIEFGRFLLKSSIL